MKTVSQGKIRTYITAIIALLILLGGLLVLLYLFSKPPTTAGENVATEGYSLLFSIYGFEGDRLNRPTEVAVDKDGNIYVADSYKHRIVVFDSTGKFVTKFGENGTGPYELKFPGAVAVAPDGRVYVASSQENKIIIYKPDHTPTWVINVAKPLAVIIKNNRLYATTDRGVMIGDLDGKLITSFGKRGPGLGSVDMPNGIAVGDKGNIFVTDSLNYRIEAFTPEGKALWTLGKPPASRAKAIRSAERTYGLPTSMAIDDDGYLYFLDAFNGEIVVADKDGKEVKKVGSWGHEDGQFYYPGGIAYAGNETFVVADKFNDRVQVIHISSPAAGPLARVTSYGLPLLAILFLLLLVAWLLRRRKTIIAIEPEFLDWAIESGTLTALLENFGKLKVVGEVYDRYKDVVIDETPLTEILEVGNFNEKTAKMIADEFSLDDVSAKTLAICKQRWSKSWLFSDDQQLAEAIEQLSITSLDHDDLLELSEELETKQPADTQPETTS